MRVLIADDHAIVRRGLRSLLESEPGLTIVAEAADGLEAIRLCREHQPDLIIVDVAMPSVSGIEVVAEAQKLHRPPLAIVLSVHAHQSYVLRALSAGARAYLLKDMSDDDLLPAIRTIRAGKPFLSPIVTTTLYDEQMRRMQKKGLSDSYYLLTARERQVLQILGQGRTNKEVATMLNISLSTVETHRTNLMQKLDLHSTAEIVLYAVRKGLVA
jgi:two-component system, NarL family, response regulator NreC